MIDGVDGRVDDRVGDGVDGREATTAGPLAARGYSVLLSYSLKSAGRLR